MSEANEQETKEALRQIATALEKLTRLGKVYWQRVHRDYSDITVGLTIGISEDSEPEVFTFTVSHVYKEDEEGRDIFAELGIPLADVCIGIVEGEEAKRLFRAAEDSLPPIQA
jgi:hypothetical protein